jgi:DNA gyrase subunit A
MTPDNFRSQNRGGKGIKGMQTIEDDYIEDILMTTTHNLILLFTNKGRVYKLKAYEIPEAGRTARGTAIVNLLELQPEEKISAIVPVNGIKDDEYLFMATKNGIVKKTHCKEYANIRKTGIQAITLRDNDELIEVKATDLSKEIFLATKYGYCIRFKETDVRPTGRSSMGVIGMNLMEGDEVIGMQLNTQGEALLFVSENGLGKRTEFSDFRQMKNRGGRGVTCQNITEKTGKLVSVRVVNAEDDLLIMTSEGVVIRMAAGTIRICGRASQGVILVKVGENGKVIDVALTEKEEEEPMEGTEISETEEVPVEETEAAIEVE